MKISTVDNAAFIAIVAASCITLWRFADALRSPSTEPAGGVATFDFSDRFGTHHVLTQLGTVEDRDAAIRRHVDDSLAVMAAFKGVP